MAQTADGAVTWTVIDEGSPGYDSLAIEDFIPLVDEVFARPSRLGHEWNMQPSPPGLQPR